MSPSNQSLEFLYLPKSVSIHIIDKEEDAGKAELLMETAENDEPIGIDCEWRPSMNVFHKAQGPSII